MNPVARAAAQQMTKRLEERERARPEDLETDVDRLYPRSTGKASEISKGMHLVARQAALQYVQRLQHAGLILSRDTIPRTLRDGRGGEWATDAGLDDFDF